MRVKYEQLYAIICNFWKSLLIFYNGSVLNMHVSLLYLSPQTPSSAFCRSSVYLTTAPSHGSSFWCLSVQLFLNLFLMILILMPVDIPTSSTVCFVLLLENWCLCADYGLKYNYSLRKSPVWILKWSKIFLHLPYMFGSVVAWVLWKGRIYIYVDILSKINTLSKDTLSVLKYKFP